MANLLVILLVTWLLVDAVTSRSTLKRISKNPILKEDYGFPSKNENNVELEDLKLQKSSHQKVFVEDLHNDGNIEGRHILVKRSTDFQPEWNSHNRAHFFQHHQDHEFNLPPGKYFPHPSHQEDIRNQQQHIVNPHYHHQYHTQNPYFYGGSYYFNSHHGELAHHFGDPHNHDRPYHIPHRPYYNENPHTHTDPFHDIPFNHYNHYNHHHHGGLDHQNSCPFHNNHHDFIHANQHYPNAPNGSHDHKPPEDQEGRLFYPDENSSTQEGRQDPEHHIDPRHA